MMRKKILIALGAVLGACLLLMVLRGGGESGTSYKHSIKGTNCSYDTESEVGAWVIVAYITGDNRKTTKVDLTGPGQSQPYHITGQVDKTFEDGKPLVYQVFDVLGNYRTGTYKLSVKQRSQSGDAEIKLNREAEWHIYVKCN
ncbi:MAG: hypothetical protein JXA10_01460 [Anaerolineae bacterium]|nr:hypothetical protein [Anaerolineae bacterium]